MQGCSGMLAGHVVFRRRGNNTILSIRPKKSNKGHSYNQTEQQRKFRLAVAYATNILSDPKRKAEYTKRAGKTKSAFNLAVKEYFEMKVNHENL